MAQDLAAQVRRVAALSNLALSDGELQAMAGELSVILTHVAQLDALELTDVLPMTHAVANEALALREDAVCPSLGAEQSAALAPEREGTQVVVPRIIE